MTTKTKIELDYPHQVMTAIADIITRAIDVREDTGPLYDELDAIEEHVNKWLMVDDELEGYRRMIRAADLVLENLT